MRHATVPLLCVLFASQAAQALHAKPELIAGATAVKPGGSIEIAVRFVIEPRWHLYWTNPGDSGMPPSVTWTLPPGVTAEPLRFPVPKRMNVGNGLVSFGYEGELVLLTRLRVPAEFSEPKLVVEAKIDWLVCREECVMESTSVTAEAAVGDGAAVQAQKFAAWNELVPKPDEAVQARIIRPGDPSGKGQLQFVVPKGANVLEIFPPAIDFAVFDPPLLTVYATEGPSPISVVPYRILPGSNKPQTGEAVLVYTTDAGKTRRRATVPVTIE